MRVSERTEDAAGAVRSAGFRKSTILLCEAFTFQPARIAEALADLIDEDIVILPSSNDERDLAPAWRRAWGDHCSPVRHASPTDASSWSPPVAKRWLTSVYPDPWS